MLDLHNQIPNALTRSLVKHQRHVAQCPKLDFLMESQPKQKHMRFEADQYIKSNQICKYSNSSSSIVFPSDSSLMFSGTHFGNRSNKT